MTEISRRAVVAVAGGGAVSVAAVGLSRPLLGGGLAWGQPVPTSFGSVRLLSSSRIGTSRTGTRHAAHAPSAAGHAAAHSSEVPVASAVHGAWTAGVVVEVAVHNRLRTPVALSPGQFRVRVDAGGPTVSLYSSDRDVAALQPGATRTMRITYLAPPADRRLSLEFDDTDAPVPVGLGVVGRPAADRSWS